MPATAGMKMQKMQDMPEMMAGMEESAMMGGMPAMAPMKEMRIYFQMTSDAEPNTPRGRGVLLTADDMQTPEKAMMMVDLAMSRFRTQVMMEVMQQGMRG